MLGWGFGEDFLKEGMLHLGLTEHVQRLGESIYTEQSGNTMFAIPGVMDTCQKGKEC